MGDIADMILDGILDSETDEYIDGEATGYPRTISGSLPWESSHKKNSSPKTYNSKYGINNYLNNQQYVYGKKNKIKTTDVLKLYHKEFMENVPYTRPSLEEHISTNWKQFVKWVKKNNKIIYSNY